MLHLPFRALQYFPALPLLHFIAFLYPNPSLFHILKLSYTFRICPFVIESSSWLLYCIPVPLQALKSSLALPLFHFKSLPWLKTPPSLTFLGLYLTPYFSPFCLSELPKTPHLSLLALLIPPGLLFLPHFVVWHSPRLTTPPIFAFSRSPRLPILHSFGFWSSPGSSLSSLLPFKAINHSRFNHIDFCWLRIIKF